MLKNVRARSRSPAASPFCLPTSHVGVFQRRNSFCINIMTISLCHLESHLIRERNSSVEAFSPSQGRRFFFAAASPSSKSVKGSHGGVLVAPCSSLRPGALVANVDDQKVECRGHDWAVCVVKSVRTSYVYITAYMTSTADARCPENVSKLRQISGQLLKQRREFIIAADWDTEPEQLETAGFLRLVGRVARRARDLLQRSQHRLLGGQQELQTMCAGWTRVLRGRRMLRCAFDVVRKPSTTQTWLLVTLLPLVPQAPSQCQEKWLDWHRAAENVVPNNSPQEVAVASLLGPALGDFFELRHLFSKWSVASERYLKSECELEGSVRRGWAAAARGQSPIFRLKLVPLNLVDESASEGQGHLFWAFVQGGLLEVKRAMERGFCNTGQFRKSVDFLKECAGEVPSIPASDQDPTRILHEDQSDPQPCACQCESQEVGPRGGDGF